MSSKYKSPKDLIGTTVTWESQSQSFRKKKTGIVLAIIHSRASGYNLLPSPETQRHLARFQDRSSVDRFLVEVPRYHRVTGEKINSWYYAPRINRLLKD